MASKNFDGSKYKGRSRMYSFKDEKRKPYVSYRVVTLAYFNNKCQYCGSTDRLELHHIDGNPGNNELSNLTLLCIKCNRKAESELNKRVRYFLEAFSQGKSQSQIARDLGISRQLSHYYLKILMKHGFLKSESLGLTPKGQAYLSCWRL